MRRLIFLIAVAVMLTATACLAHGLHPNVSAGQAQIISIVHEDGTPFSNESYEVRAPNEETPYQIGHTDRSGKVTFIPTTAGTWLVRVWSEDGHGASVDVPITEADLAASTTTVQTEQPLSRRFKVIMGVSLLFGFFGFVTLILKRQS